MIILNVQKFTKVNRQGKRQILLKLIVYGHITNEINKMNHVSISKNESNQILKQNEINVRSLVGYGNVSKKRKEILASSNNSKCAIRIHE